MVDKRYDAPPSNDAVVGLYCYPPDVFDIIDGLSPSNRGELEITDVNRAYAQQGRLRVRARRGLVARRRQALGRSRRRRPPDRRDRSEQVVTRIPLTRHEDERGFFMELMRASGLPKPVRQANLAWSRQGVIRALALSRARPGRSLPLPARDGARRRARPRDGRGVHGGHRRRQPGRDLRARVSTRTGTRRSPTASSVTSSPRSTTRPIPTSTASRGTIRASRTSGARDAPILSARDTV